MAPITLNRNIFDLATAKSNPLCSTPKPNYILIECNGPLKQLEITQLNQLHVTLNEYVGNETYLCRYEFSDLGKVEELPFIKHAVTYPSELKMSSGLRELLKPSHRGTTKGM